MSMLQEKQVRRLKLKRWVRVTDHDLARVRVLANARWSALYIAIAMYNSESNYYINRVRYILSLVNVSLRRVRDGR